MITSVRIKGWKSHKDSKFEFSEGTNVLVGVMGAGKSSILDAISFALFGTFPLLKTRKVSLDDVIMCRPKKENKMEVKVSFKVDGDVYAVYRSVERGKGTTKAEIRKNGELIETGSSRTTEKTEKVLKINYDLFSRAVYSEQNGLDYFLRLAKGQRMKKIDDLLQIDKFEKARSSTASLVNRVKSSIVDKTKIVEEIEKKEEFDEIEKIEKAIKELAQRNDKLRKELGKIENEKDEIEDKLEKMKGLENEIKELEKKRDVLLGRINNLSEDIKSTRIDIDKESLKEKKKELKRNIEKNNKRLEKLKEEFRDVMEKKQKSNLSIEDLVSKIEKLKSVEGRCPVCDRKLTESHRKKLIEKWKKEISKHEKVLKKSIKKMKDLNEEIKKMEMKIEEIKEGIYKTEEFEGKIKDFEEKKRKLDELAKTRKGLDEKISKGRKGLDEKAIENLQNKLRKLYGSYGETKTSLESNERFLEEKKNQLEKLIEKKKMFENYKTEIKRMKFLVEDLKKLEKALKATQITLRVEFIEAVNSTMNKIWGCLYPYDDYINIRLSIKEGDYTLELMDSSGNWISVDGIVSGGERTTAVLALRIAFALVLSPSLKWLVLDEPTHNLDEQAKEYLAEVLRTKIKEFIDQVFLITHDEKLENAVTGYLYKLERKKEKNEPTKVIVLSTPKD